MSNRMLGYGLIVLGVVVMGVCLAADALGLRASPGIDWRQWLGAVVGLLMAIFGMWSVSRPAGGSK